MVVLRAIRGRGGSSDRPGLLAALKGMVDDEAFKSLLAKLGERPQYMSGEDFEKFWDQDYQKVGTLLKQLIKK